MIVGSCWLQESSKGVKYISISLNTLDLPKDKNLRLAMFKVKEKKTDKHPDYTLVWTPKDEKESVKSDSAKVNTDNPFSDSIPF